MFAERVADAEAPKLVEFIEAVKVPLARSANADAVPAAPVEEQDAVDGATTSQEVGTAAFASAVTLSAKLALGVVKANPSIASMKKLSLLSLKC
jgi:hypothetical protein